MAVVDELLARLAPTWQPSMPPALARQPTLNTGGAFEQRLPYQPQGMQMMQRPPAFPYGAQRAPMPNTDFSNMPTNYAWGGPPPQPAPVSPTGKDMSRIPYEPVPQQSAVQTKGAREDMQPQQKEEGGFLPATMRPILMRMVQQDPSLMRDPRRMGRLIQKLAPMVAKMDKEKYAASKEERAESREARAEERSAAAQRLETHKLWLEQVKQKHSEAKDAWARLKDVEDPTKEFEGDRKALVKRYTEEYETAEKERKALQSANPYKQKGGKEDTSAGASYAKGTQRDPGAAAPMDAKTHSELSTQYELGMDKAKDALRDATSIDERNRILGNALQWTDAARKEAGMPPLSDKDKEDFVSGLPSHDIRTWGEQAEDWLGHKAEEYFPTAYQFYKDMQSFKPSVTDDPLHPGTLASYLNPLTVESQFAHGIRKARGMEPTAAQMERNETSSIPERALGGLRALGAAATPMSMVSSPLATGMMGGIGQAAERATDNPWAGIAAQLLAGGAAAALGRGRGAMGPEKGPAPMQGPQMGPAPMQGPQMGPAPMQGPSWPPHTPAPAGTPQLPPPDPSRPMRSNIGPLPGRTIGEGPTVRPKAGLYGQEALGPSGGRAPAHPPMRSAFEIPPERGQREPISSPDVMRASGPGEQLRLPPPERAPEPTDPISRAEAAADITMGREPAPPVEKPSRLQSDVTQFGDHAVGDTVNYRGKPRVIEALVPKAPGHAAAKVRLSGLKGPVTITAIEPLSAAKGFKYAQGDRVKWDLPAGFGEASGVVQSITTSAKGRAMAKIKRSDGQTVDVAVDSLKNV